MKPGVIAPSHAPKMKRTTKSAPKDLQAAWAMSATAHMKMLMLDWEWHVDQRFDKWSISAARD
jgi:hypothetical protein